MSEPSNVESKTETVTYSDVTLTDGSMFEVNSVAWSPDGSKIVSGSYNMVCVWDSQTGAQLDFFGLGMIGGVNSVAWSSDGSKIACGGDNTVRVWDSQTGAELMKWDNSTGDELMQLGGHVDEVWSVSWSPDGSKIVSGSIDKTVRVWDSTTGTELMSLVGHANGVFSVSFSPDGTLIMSVSIGITVRVWDSNTGAELMMLVGHTGPADSVSFSPDGTMIVSASDDNTACIWDSTTGNLVTTLVGHTGSVHSVSFSPDGARIVSGSGDETIRVWSLADGMQMTESRNLEDVINQAFANAEIIDLTENDTVDLVNTHESGQGGEESKTRSYSNHITMGYVSPYKKVLNVTVPDFNVFNCYHESLDMKLRCKIANEVQKCREDVQKVERLRWKQRRDAGAKRSVYLFLCVKNTDNILQPDLNVYVYCAFALQSLGWRHRMVVYDERVSHKSLLETAIKLNYPLSAAFVKQNVECMSYVNNYDKLKTAVEDIGDDEEIALVYLSAHGEEDGVLSGPWDGGEDIRLSQRRTIRFGNTLNKKASKDCQIFLNSCYAGRSTAEIVSMLLSGRIVLAASLAIPSGSVQHRFQIDAGNNRLYFSAQCLPVEIKAYSSHFVGEAPVSARPGIVRRPVRQTSGNPRDRQRRRFSMFSEDSGSETESEDENALQRGYTDVTFRF